jgi:hypothetical protein
MDITNPHITTTATTFRAPDLGAALVAFGDVSALAHCVTR